MPTPTFEEFINAALGNPVFIDKFSNGDRAGALQAMNFVPSDPYYDAVLTALNKINYDAIKPIIVALQHSLTVDPYAIRPAN